MQSKHGWDKLIKLSGNKSEDFKKVLKLLEDNKIFSGKCRPLAPRSVKDGQLINVYSYKIQVKGYEIEAHFSEYVESGERLLNNAWVSTQK